MLKHEGDGDSNRSLSPWNRVFKNIWKNWRLEEYLKTLRVLKIVSDISKSLEKLKNLAVTQTPVKNPSVAANVKNWSYDYKRMQQTNS